MTRRCIESKILNSDKFSEMPLSAQMLYIYLNLEADNYGFLASTQGTIKRIGATQSDLEILVINEFLLQLTKDVYVIKHWFIHNKEDKRNTPDFKEFDMVELKNKQYILKNTYDEEISGTYHYIPENKDLLAGE